MAIQPQRFLDAVLPVVRQCAAASRLFHGDVADVGKKADTTLTGARAQHASTALTVLDTAFQDLILGAVHARFPRVRCIAEERTAMRRAFAGNGGDEVVILDPIDGTLHFQRGDGPYHISIGLARGGRMVAAAVARPTEDKMFTAVRGRGAWVQVGSATPKQLQLPEQPRTKKAFVSTKARAFRAAAREHLEPRDYPIGAALVLTQLAEGDLAASLTRQVEVYDVGPPSLIATEAGARCALRGGRTPRYSSSRKFSYYMCTASAEIESNLSHLLRSSSKK